MEVLGRAVWWEVAFDFLEDFLGPRGPLGTPLYARPPARTQEKSGSTVQLYVCFTDPYNHTYSESS